MGRIPAIGRAIPRRDGPAKVTGQARYIDDLSLPGMVYGVTVRSPIPRGIMRGISYDSGVPWDEITVVTAADIPGRNVVALILDDQPYLAAGRRWPEACPSTMRYSTSRKSTFWARST